MEHPILHGHTVQLGEWCWVLWWLRVGRVDISADVGVEIRIALVMRTDEPVASLEGVEEATAGNVTVPNMADDGGEGRVGGAIGIGQDLVCVGTKTEPVALAVSHCKRNLA